MFMVKLSEIRHLCCASCRPSVIMCEELGYNFARICLKSKEGSDRSSKMDVQGKLGENPGQGPLL